MISALSSLSLQLLAARCSGPADVRRKIAHAGRPTCGDGVSNIIAMAERTDEVDDGRVLPGL